MVLAPCHFCLFCVTGGFTISHIVRLIETSAILDMDATTLASMIKNKNIRSVDVTNKFIQHLQSINPSIHCVVEERFSDALHEAERSDDLLDSGQGGGRLFGVPISVKKSLDVKSMRTTGGLIHRSDYVASHDSEAVRRLKKEGAIVLCKTNTSTACLTFESNNKLYGRTNNPWCMAKTAGGSSGGEAALIASGGAAAGVGSDLAGSLRLPAHFNGVISFKSGANAIPLTGHFPKPIHQLQSNMMGLGPMTKSVADSELMYTIMSDIPMEKIDPSVFRLIMPPILGKYPLSKDIEQVWRAVRQFFKGMFIEKELPGFIWRTPLLHLQVLTINGAKDLYPSLFNKTSFPLFQAWLREKIRHDTDYDRHFLKTMLLAKAGSKLFRTKVSSNRIKKLRAKILEWQNQFDQFLDRSVLLLPVFGKPAGYHGELAKELLSNRFLYRKCMPFTVLPNVLGLPALSIPIARNKSKLPISVQLIAKRGNEQALFYYGRLLEKHFLGYERAVLE